MEHPALLYLGWNMFMVWVFFFFFLMAAKDLQMTVKLETFFFLKKAVFLNYLEHASLIFSIK